MFHNSFIKSMVPSCVLHSYTSEQATYNIPSEAARAFVTLFTALSPLNLRRLGLTGYGLTDTSLEQVFLKVDDQNREQRGDMTRKRSISNKASLVRFACRLLGYSHYIDYSRALFRSHSLTSPFVCVNALLDPCAM